MTRALGGLRVLARWLGRILLGILLWFAFMQTFLRLAKRYWHFPAPAFTASLLASPVRKALQPPSEVVRASGIQPGMKVLEIGPGPGTFTIEAARVVGPEGKVVAFDTAPAMISRLQRTLAKEGVTNVEARVAEAYSLPLASASVDLAFMVTVLAEIPDRQRALRELKRVLKPDGMLSVTEFLVDPDYPWSSTLTRWCEEAGFRLSASHKHTLWYTLNFTPV